MGQYTEAVQKLYVAYFNRPADVAGLTYWEGVVTAAKGSTTAVSAAFAASAEYKAAFAGMDEYHVVNTVYMNLFGRAAEPAGLQYWGQALINKTFTIDAVVTQIAGGAQGTDLVAYNSKVAAATAFTASLDTSAEILAYSGDAANAIAKAFLTPVVDATTLAAAITPANLDAVATSMSNVPGLTFATTASVDTLNGTANNDLFTVTSSSATNGTLSTFDSINGAGGNDTLQIVDTSASGVILTTPTNVTVTSVENLKAATSGAFGGGSAYDVSGFTGLTKATFQSADSAAAANSVKVADTTATTLTVAAGTAAITGGTVDSIINAGTGTSAVTGAALTNVSVKGGGAVTIDNLSSAGASAGGSTLTTVTLDGNTGGATLSGKGIANVTLKNLAATATDTINNATAKHTLNLTTSDAGKAANVITVVDTTAETITIAAGGSDNNLKLSGGAVLKTVTAMGGKMTLDLLGATNTAVTSFDGSAATGNLTLSNIAATTTSIKTGAGADSLTVTAATVKDNSATTTVDETVNAAVSTGAGADSITVAVSGTGKVTIDAGAGNDTVNITGRGTDTLAISLGDGNDTFTIGGGVAINGTDVIDAGTGTDTLTLAMVGSANIGAFTGFDVFDTAAMAKTLDVDILASKNTVTEFIASGDVGGGAILQNIGAGVGFRATGDMGTTNILELVQKTAGALTITVDEDETGTADTTIDTAGAFVKATNATSLKAVFDTAYLATISGETTTGDNVTTLTMTGGAATTLDITSGGALSNNVLAYTDTNNKLATVTVSGAQALTFSNSGTALATLDASASTGGLTFSLANLKDTGTVKLGSGVDVITVTNTSTNDHVESISGFEKTAAAAVGTDATAAAAAVKDADVLNFAAAAVTADATITGGAIAKGVLSFSGAGPSTLTAAIAIADVGVATVGDTVVFQYLSDTYVFSQGGATDIIVKLTGVTGVTNLVEDGSTNHLFIV